MGLFGKKEEENKETVEEPEEDEENIYETNINCSNCEKDTTVEIPCGTKIKDYIKGKKCKYCECILQEDLK